MTGASEQLSSVSAVVPGTSEASWAVTAHDAWCAVARHDGTAYVRPGLRLTAYRGRRPRPVLRVEDGPGWIRTAP